MTNDCSIIIKHGRLVSAEFNDEKNDILIENGRIKDISYKIEPPEGCKIINADNLIVAPGFINVHSHDDFYLHLKDHHEILKSLAYQGITTCVGGNCGISSYPFKKEKEKELNGYQGFLFYSEPKYSWESLEDYFALIDKKILFNFMALTGHGTLRVITNGFEGEISTKNFTEMKRLLINCLEQGSYGISAGLMYMPGTFSKTDELIELAKITARYSGTIFSTHMRGYSDTYIESVKESIEISMKAGIKVQISHLGPFGIKFGPKVYEVLELIRKANNEGAEVSFDSLAYCGGSTTIMAIIPPWAYSKGLERFLEDIKEDSFFEKVVSYMEDFIPKWPSWEGTGWTDNFVRSLGWENLYILVAKNSSFVGKNFDDIAISENISRNEALRKVLLEERGAAVMYMAGVGACIDDNGDMSYFDAMLENKNSLITVDALFSYSGNTMPYAYGTFQRIINRYVKTKKTLTLRDAIVKFTEKAANLFSLKERGFLKKGCFADIAIFSLEKMTDYPDIFAHKPKLSTGIIHLLINGKLLIENGSYNAILAGNIIRRP